MKYICFFSTESDQDLCLSTSPAGINKSSYVAKLLHENGHSVEIISPAWSKCGRWKYWKAFDKALDNEIVVHQLATFGVPWRCLTPLQWLYSLGQLFFLLLFQTKKDEPVLVYHSYYLSIPILAAMKIKKFKLILEVEEVYQDILALPQFMQLWEDRILHSAYCYILSTEELRGKVNRENKPDIIINGSYEVERPRTVLPFKDRKVHCVYAGTLDPSKGGAAAAVAAAAFLPEKYYIHILGFGSSEQISAILGQIHNVRTTSRCGLNYEGVIQGEDYIRFLQRCQIGLSTQIPEGEYIKSSFPSKIMVYLANGLQVVSARLPSVVQSGVGDILTYYITQTPKAIADAIQSVDLSVRNTSVQRLRKLDEQARIQLQNLLEDL